MGERTKIRSMTQESYDVRAFWGGGPESDADCGMRLGRMIEKLMSIDQSFTGWHKGMTPVNIDSLSSLFDESRFYYDFSPQKVMPQVGFFLTIWSPKEN